MFGHPVSGGHPSHYRPSPVLLDLFLRMSPLQVVAHPSADLARFPWTSSSAVSFSGGHPFHCRSSSVLLFLFLRLSPLQAVIHPSADPARCCWTLFFDCLLFRPSPIHVPSWPGASGLHRRLSRFRRSPIPLLTEPGAALPFSSIVSSSGGHPSECQPFLLLDFIFGYPVFRWSPIPLLTEPGAA